MVWRYVLLRGPTLSAFAALAIPFGLSFSSGKNPIERLGDGGGSGGVTLSANRIAHEVLGTSLDELPPQTRRVLAHVRTFVQALMKAQGCAQRDIRFSRSQLRQTAAVSDTQLKVHLARLAELEYLLIHRAQRGQGFEYELLFDGASDDGGKVLSGLIDVATLNKHGYCDTYDAQRSASNASQSAPGRGADGAAPGRGQAAKPAANPHAIEVLADMDGGDTQTRATPQAVVHTSYRQTHELQSALAAATA